MYGSIDKMFRELRLYWKNYVFQSFFAMVSIFIVLMVLNIQQAVIVASIGASVFIVFAMPKSITAEPRNLIGGYMVGFLTGFIVTLIPHNQFLFSMILYSIAVGLSIFIMVVIDMEHPPASGVALGVAISGFSFKVFIAVLTSAIILSLIHRLFRPYLKDLT
jgi:CBS-domain-containing membrane protein